MTNIIRIINNELYLESPQNTLTKITPTNNKKELNKFFDKDIVDTDFNILSSPVRNKLIIGYFSTSQQVKFGKTKSGNTIYQVTTFDQNLPYFLVSYGGKLVGKIIITFKFKDWNNALPKGEIVNVIGLYDESNLINTLQYINSIYRKNIFKSSEYKLNDFESKIKRELINTTVFSIDPVDCIDVDDALSIDETDDSWIVGVYIAQPICWLSESELMTRSIDSFSTLYSQPFASNNNLWGDQITKNASLTQGEIKPVYYIKFIINKFSKQISEIFHGPGQIINSIKTDYESCLSYPIIKKLFGITSFLSNEIIDTHQLVSYWMVKANNFLGSFQKLKELNIPYRIMKKEETGTNNFGNIIDSDIRQIFLNRTNESAIYQINCETNYHSGLEKFDYIHFTSPIRRVIDCLIHWCLTYNVNFGSLLEKYSLDIQHFNSLDSNTKKYHNNIKLLNCINELKWDQDDMIEIDGVIYEKFEDKNIWTIWTNELGFQRVKMWDNKFDYLKDANFKKSIDKINIGDRLKLKIYRKTGFLPKEKILIVSSLNLI